MMKRLRHKTSNGWVSVLTGGVFLSAVRVASAQSPGHVVDREGGWMTWLVAVGLVLLVCVTGFLSAKRSHLN